MTEHLGICQKKQSHHMTKLPSHINTFTIAELLNIDRFTLLDQRINKMCSIYKIELYSTIKNEMT